MGFTKHCGPLSFAFIKTYLIILIPLLLLPIFFLDESREKELLFPLFEIQSTSDVSSNYLTSSNSLFMGGLILAIAVEDSGLDRRIAISFLNITGSSPKGLLFGLMTITSFLSLLVSNTATTAMMIPILNGIFETANLVKDETGREKYKNGLLLAIAYASNIGGTGFLTGSPPNLVAPGALEQKFGPDSSISFIKWAMFAIPLMIVNLIFGGIWLYFFFGFSKYSQEYSTEDKLNGIVVEHGNDTLPENKINPNDIIRKKKKELGRISTREVLIASLFGFTVLLWFLKTPKMFPGWSDLFPEVPISSATPVFLTVILMFIIPREFHFWPFVSWDTPPKSSESLITWKVIEKKLPWGIMFLLGGGYAMAGGTKDSGLSKWLVENLKTSMMKQEKWVINLIFCLIMTFGTELMSNAAAANIVLPILIDLSIGICSSPLFFVVSTALCSSYAFMVPIATGPNALVFQASTMSQFTMIKAGTIMNLVCIVTTTAAINLYADQIYEITPPPQWVIDYYKTTNNTECLTSLNIE
ncbi:SLC13A2_3_5 [Lepeophtheirus salmonis]|uniref:SLC13A2_3_5 n=1 Tax=Lepeophtheirus salmonis TaxID=72036 RepID=A0A7R8CYU9_LEPSM|nr:SLC13A2_3_5 [Lepeophtheirus salmonis]CAF2971813.1 SLC13A2_3_5 [Lepeophtheirus salmonis]